MLEKQAGACPREDLVAMKTERSCSLVLPFVLILTALTPSLACSQTETPAPVEMNQRTSDQGSSITNARVIEISKLGLDDEIVIAKIRNGICDFQLRDTDLVDLKKAGVSPKVIAAMLDSSVPTSPRDTINKNEGHAAFKSPLAAGTARIASVSTMQTYSQDEDGSGSTQMRQVYRLETANTVYDVTGWESLNLRGKGRKRPALEIGEVVSYPLNRFQSLMAEPIDIEGSRTNEREALLDGQAQIPDRKDF